MRLFDWLLSARERRRAERAEAQAEAAETTRRERDADETIRDAYVVAHRLAQHRAENHFAQRMRAAYGGQGKKT